MIQISELQDVMRHCLYKEGEDASNGKEIKGVINGYLLNPDRVKEKKPQIDAMLVQLPDEFMKSKGGGWSFLQACETRDGELWGQHVDIEALVVLGIAAGSVEYLAPREMWGSLPGGMPYFAVLLDGPAPLDLPAMSRAGSPGARKSAETDPSAPGFFWAAGTISGRGRYLATGGGVKMSERAKSAWARRGSTLALALDPRPGPKATGEPRPGGAGPSRRDPAASAERTKVPQRAVRPERTHHVERTHLIERTGTA